MSKKSALSTVVLAAWMIAGAVGLVAHSSGTSVQAGCSVSVTAPSGTSGNSCPAADDGGTGNG
jgi:hypothetical protein